MEFIKKMWNIIKFVLEFLGNGKKSECNTNIEFKKNDIINSYNNNIIQNNGKINIVTGEKSIVNDEQMEQ